MKAAEKRNWFSSFIASWGTASKFMCCARKNEFESSFPFVEYAEIYIKTFDMFINLFWYGFVPQSIWTMHLMSFNL